MEISIIVLSKNEGHNIRTCLEGVFSQEIDMPYEVLLIDSGSRDNTIDIAREYNVRIYEIPPNEFGHGRTRNLGASLARGKFLVFLTADAVPANKRWLLNLVNSAKDGTDIAASYSRQIPKEKTSPMERWDIARVNPERREVKKMPPSTSKAELRYLISFQDISSCIKRSVWEEIKFNEDIIMSEDQDWARRALQAGYAIVYEPESIVFHSHNYTPGEIFRRSFDEAWSLSDVLGWPVFPNPVKEFLTFVYHLSHDLYMILVYDRNIKWLMEAPLFRFMRRAGLLLGSYSRYIPERFRSHLSYYIAKRRE